MPWSSQGMTDDGQGMAGDGQGMTARSCAEGVTSVGHHGGGFDFDFGAVFHQVDHLH